MKFTHKYMHKHNLKMWFVCLICFHLSLIFYALYQFYISSFRFIRFYRNNAVIIILGRKLHIFTRFGDDAAGPRKPIS